MAKKVLILILLAVLMLFTLFVVVLNITGGKYPKYLYSKDFRN